MGARTSLYSNNEFTSLLVPAVRNADVNSSSLDLRGYEDAVIQFHLGDSADTLSGTNKIELEIEESDDNSNWTDVANADLTNYVTATNPGTVALIDAPTEDQAVFTVGYKGTKRYIRGVVNYSGTHSTGIPVAITGIRKALHQPVNAVA